MNKNPLVSIIIPVYNSENYIGKCIESILAQTYKNYEIILINDGSKDNSLDILKEYEKQNGKIKIYNQSNCGVANTRNNGIQYSSGEYIMFIDNDDYISPDYIEIFINEINKNDYDIVIGGYKRINTKEKILFHNHPINNGWSKYTIIAPWAKLYKKETLQKFQAEFLDYGIAEDVYFVLNLYSRNLKIKTIEYEGYNWFYNDASISNTLHKGLNESIDLTYVLNKLMGFDTSENSEKDYFYYFIYRFCIYYLLTSGRYSDKTTFQEEYHKLQKWLDDNLNVKITIPSTEKFSIKLCILFFQFISKFGLINIFSQIYCKSQM